MIEVHLPAELATRLLRELHRAGANEIGGVLATEHVSDGVFRICDLSVQRSGGTPTFFVRDPVVHRRFIRRFLDRTGHQYDSFNYLGEWHSHPSFPVQPSTTDLRQMQALIEERDQVANFLVLVIVKRERDGTLAGSAHAFRRGIAPVRVRLVIAGNGADLPTFKPAPRLSLRKLLALRHEGCDGHSTR